jgi:hypothetical protein
MADTSLWPVVVGGLLTLGGIGAGLVASAYRDAAQERREAKKRREDKFEELVAAVYEFDHWLNGLRRWDYNKPPSNPEAPSPFAKVQSITSVYFPQFSEMVRELDLASGLCIVWIYNSLPSSDADSANEFFDPYAGKRDTLLHALGKFGFQ